MRKALALGRQGIGLTSPNPPVGAVVVKEGRELGSGWHRKAGGPHAEVEAIRNAAERNGSEALEGATIYVSLEPCSTRGRTGPCTEAIKQAGIARVVFGATDPNPAHAGRAAEILAARGIEVREGIEEASAELLIRPFAKVQRCGLPWVTIKTAMSLDGRITRPVGEGQWLSGPESRAEVQKLRRTTDAIMSSGRTVRADNPRLTVRGEGDSEREQPWRVILTSRENGVPGQSRIRTDQFADRTLVQVGRRIESVLRELAAERGVCSVLVEAGGRLMGRLMDEDWADEVVIFLTPLLTGGPVPAIGGEGSVSLAERRRLDEIRYTRSGEDIMLRARLAGTGGLLER